MRVIRHLGVQQRGSAARWRPGVLLATGATALVLSAMGCGGSTKSSGEAASDNSVAAKSAQEILTAAVNAAKGADSVTVNAKSTVRRAGALKLAMRLTQNSGAGKVVALGNEFEIVRVGNDLYVKASSRFYRRLGVARDTPEGTWLKVLASTALGQVADLSGTTERLLSTSGEVSKGRVTSIDGEPVIELRTSGKLYKGRLYVKTTGEPFPAKLTKQGRGTAAITLTDWNKTPAPGAPSPSVSPG